MGKKNDASRHFSQIWKNVICKEVNLVLSECDNDFVQICGLESKPADTWRRSLEKEYRSQRQILKEYCYQGNADKGFLDGRKLAAVLCKALIKEKAFVFDSEKAMSLLANQKGLRSDIDLNLWICHNVLVNYKLAYYVSLQLVYLTLLGQLLSSKEATGKETIDKETATKLAKELNKIGHLCQYPRNGDVDSFDVNIIIGLARSDFGEKEFNMFLFAMQLYQIEMYTIEKLKQQIRS